MSNHPFTRVEDHSPPATLPVGVELPPMTVKARQFGAAAFREVEIPSFAKAVMVNLFRKMRRQFYERGYTLRFSGDKATLQQYLNIVDRRYYLTPVGQDKLDELLEPTPSIEQSAFDLSEPELVLPELRPEIAAKLKGYQIEPARQILRALQRGRDEWGYPGAWDCSDLGTGKTYQTLAGAIESGLEIGVICPLSVIPAWHRAFRHFGFKPLFVTNIEGLRTGRREWVRKEIYTRASGERGKRFSWTPKPEDTVLIFDEAACFKNEGTLNQALLLAAVRQNFPIVCVSGTIALDPTHMRATGRVIGLHKGGEHFTEFLKTHGCRKQTTTYKFCRGVRGRKILVNLHHRIFPARGARVRIEDLGSEFPETQILCEAYETGETAEIAAAYSQWKESIRKLTAQHAEEARVSMLIRTGYMDARHVSERCKVGAICETAQAEIDEGRSVAIFVNFDDVRRAIMDKLKTRCGIWGEQTTRPGWREGCIQDFQQGRSRIIVCNIAAGGVGVSLHDETGDYPRTALVMPTDKADQLKQVLGRVHRAGGKSRSRQLIMFAAGTIEEQICERMRGRLMDLSSLIDGDLTPEADF